MCEATQHNHFQGGWINSLSFHQFFSWSQLTDESKGGYLKGSIQVPIGITKIELALFARDGRNPHPNLLFVTPDIKQTGEKPKEITAHDYKVILELKSDELHISQLNYWPNKSSKEILPKNTWNKVIRSY